MSSISGTNVAAPIVPFDTADTFPTHDAQYGRGGYRSVATVAERDAIPVARRVNGMRVMVTADPNPANNIEWDLNAGNWVQAPFIQANIEATSSAVAAEAAQVAAEAARDSSFANAKGAATIADARALVADTETFIVYAAGALTFKAYRRTSSTTEVFLGDFPTSASINSNFNLTQSALFSLSTSLINTQTIITTHHAFEE